MWLDYSRHVTEQEPCATSLSVVIQFGLWHNAALNQRKSNSTARLPAHWSFIWWTHFTDLSVSTFNHIHRSGFQANSQHHHTSVRMGQCSAASGWCFLWRWLLHCRRGKATNVSSGTAARGKDTGSVSGRWKPKAFPSTLRVGTASSKHVSTIQCWRVTLATSSCFILASYSHSWPFILSQAMNWSSLQNSPSKIFTKA